VGISGGVDVASQYFFRGVRQNSTGLVVWPYGGLTVRALSNKGALERLAIGFDFWNSLNSGDTGSDGPAAQAWYESRLSGALDLRFDQGVTVTTSYTTYISPNDLFTTAKEIGVKVAIDDARWFGRAAVRPYAFVGFEIDTAPGAGQLDGGLHAGRYLEVGATPGYSGPRANFTVPVKVGLSLDDYYELGDTDNAFGFASLGGFVSVPLGGASKIGQWQLRGGVELHWFGETTKAFNGDDGFQPTALVGIAIRP
jgi:hypothetical protein